MSCAVCIRRFCRPGNGSSMVLRGKGRLRAVRCVQELSNDEDGVPLLPIGDSALLLVKSCGHQGSKVIPGGRKAAREAAGAFQKVLTQHALSKEVRWWQTLWRTLVLRRGHLGHADEKGRSTPRSVGCSLPTAGAEEKGWQTAPKRGSGSPGEALVRGKGLRGKADAARDSVSPSALAALLKKVVRAAERREMAPDRVAPEAAKLARAGT